MAAVFSEFAAAVRAHDWPRHIAIQFAPESKRGDLTALFVFNAEIDRITRNASDPLPGEIRLQWWREVLNGEREGEARRHPLASVLLDVIHQHDLPLGTFGRFLEAKTFALYHDAFPDTHSFEAWCGETEGALLQMAALILDPVGAANASDASGHGSIVLATGSIFSQLPRMRAKGQCWLPADLLSACGLTREAFFEGNDSAAMANAMSAMAEQGLKHFRMYSETVKRLPKSLRPAYLPVHAGLVALERVANKPGDVFADGVSVSNLRKFLSMARAAIF